MIPTWVFIFIIGALLVWILNGRRTDKTQSTIPGPVALPIIGNLFQIGHAALTSKYPLSSFAKQYGDVFKIKLPKAEIVVFSSWKACHAVANIPESCGRYREGILEDRSFGHNAGIVFSEGEIWEKTSRWVIKNLRDCGFGKFAITENAVRTELVNFRNKHFTQHDDAILRVHGLFVIPSLRIMYSIIAGKCELSEELLEILEETMERMNKAIGFGTIGSAICFLFPGYRHYFPKFSGKTICTEGIEVYRKLSENVLKEARQNLSLDIDDSAQTFAEKFAQQAMMQTQELSLVFQDVNFHVLFQDLLQAGSHNTANIVDGFLLYMLRYPEVQQKVYEEVMGTTGGKTGDLAFIDRQNMPFLRAVLLEVHRVCNILPMMLPRKALRDFTYEGYKIKKDNFVIFDVTSLYANPDYFPNPEEFNPERFLDASNGEFVGSKYMIPFGIGRRSCPGEQVGDAETFLIAASLVRDYHILPVPGEELPSTEMQVGFTARTRPFNVLFRKRQNSN